MNHSLPHKARIIEIEHILPDTRIIRVARSGTGYPAFQAGQYAVLGFEGVEPRSFSIASPPSQPFLEFHIKNAGHGLSAYVFEKLKKGEDVWLSDPMGISYWQRSSRPLLALGGGVGIAPLKAIIEEHLAVQDPQPVYLYWGARDRSHLYLDKAFVRLQEKWPPFKYIPVLSEEKDELHYRSGFIGDLLQRDFATLNDLDIYMAGPAAMIEATLPVILQKGAEKNRIFSDFFSI